jgi:hypothetical protein
MHASMLEPFIKSAEEANEKEGEMFEWKKPLVTEMDYWSAIETIGSYRHSTEHGFMRGRLNTEQDGSSVLISSARAYLQQKRLVEELEEKFGVVAPQNCPQLTMEQRLAGEKPPEAPEGKRWYWDWYKDMGAQWEKKDYEDEVCSGCPYSEGPAGKVFIKCSLFNGCASRLHPDKASCLVLSRPWGGGTDDDYSQDEFFAKMREEHGDDAVKKFFSHRAAIQLEIEKERSQ